MDKYCRQWDRNPGNSAGRGKSGRCFFVYFEQKYQPIFKVRCSHRYAFSTTDICGLGSVSVNSLICMAPEAAEKNVTLSAILYKDKQEKWHLMVIQLKIGIGKTEQLYPGSDLTSFGELFQSQRGKFFGG